jgi:hypothetical protein
MLMTNEIDNAAMYALGEPFLLLVTTGASERNTKIIKFYFYGLLTYKKKYE